MTPIWEYRLAFDDPIAGCTIESSTWLTDHEAIYWHGYGRDNSRRMDETKRDRNLHPPEPLLRLPGKLPAFNAQTDDELRVLWRHYRADPEARRLILEVVHLRRMIGQVESWLKGAEAAPNKGDLGKPFCGLHKLRIMLRTERERRGDV